MSGLEILGGISAIISIIEASVKVADRISEARDKDAWTDLIDRNRKEMRSLQQIVELVKEEEALHTKDIIEELAEISEWATKVLELLKTMEGSGFRSNLQNGRKWKKDLLSYTLSISNAKATLTLKIASAHVGLTVGTDKKYAVQMKKIESVESQLNKLLDSFVCLEISDLVRGRTPRRDGTVPLDDNDLLALGLQAEDSPYQDGSRLIDNNLTLDQAMMINGTVGTEGFIEPKHVKIINNVARHQSVLVNASVSVNEMDKNRDHHLKVIEVLARNGAIRNDQIEQGPRTAAAERARSGMMERTRVSQETEG
ncbi:hypothetical protein FB567DRAFT_91082 [Paraphoma chrysanthemicola]|uniref:Uncharacterized protein n=1 Tax=Paraphoma chrysanthemicola TaxID=798071 RepID=A0A8K0VX47_9PLEO|nr:hypothetical protein FB567DRAFT_91082 [Paraphoma chrysanthemicola]